MLGFSVRERNKRIAKRLGVSYNHKRYKEFLQNKEMPLKSLSKVIFFDVYDQKLVGYDAGPVATAIIPDDIRAAGWQANYDAHRALHPKLLEEAMQTARMVTLKEQVNPYIEAFSFATDARLITKYDIQSCQDKYNVNDNLPASNRLRSYPMLNIICGGEGLSGCWMNHRGFGKGFQKL